MDDFAISEAHRLLANLIRVGTVTEIDEAKALVKVRVAGDISDWIPWTTERAGPVRNWKPPRPGEQVVVLAPHGDLSQAFVGQSLYREKYPVPGTSKYQDVTTYPDGSSVSFDTRTNTLTVNVAGNGIVNINCKNATVTATTQIKLDTPKVKVTGDVEADGDVKAGSISLKNHKHGGVSAGGAQTGTPV